ncbi:MAG: histidinol-phosphatase [Prosthecobacter sp.]
MSKHTSTKKKAAQGKAKPVTRGHAKKAVPKKPVAKTAPKKSKPAAKPVGKSASKKKPLPAKTAGAKKKAPAKKIAQKKAPPPVRKPAAKAVKAKATVKAPSPKKEKAPVSEPKKPKTAKKAVAAKPQVVAAPSPALEPVVSKTSQTAGIPLPPQGPTKSGALFYDSHMHTPLCKHAWGEPEEYAEQGVKAGLKGIIFTCHCPMPSGYWPTVRMSESEFDTYVELVQRAAVAFKGKLDVRLGIESEFYPGCEEYIAEFHKRADFHYVLGGLHWQAREYLNKYETGTIENFRRTYFDHLAKAAESGLYDCLAHPDLVKNYHPDSWCFAIVKNTVTEALDRIAATGVAMELNTSGLNKSYSEMNPGDEMLSMMAERKIPVVIGSDAHRAVRVGEHFVTALNKLSEAGYEKVSYFLERKRIDLKIPAVLASLKKATDHNA